MSTDFAATLLLVGLVGMSAVLANRLTARIPVPAPALLLIGAAIVVQAIPSLHRPAEHTVDHIVTVALIPILFDGGWHLGRSRFHRALGPILATGVIGTFLTTAGVAAIAHWLLGLDWFPSVLVATAIAPTDPAVVFSVLGPRKLAGDSGTVLEGESGANDPVGIALMASLLSAGHLSGAAFGQIAGQFALELVVGGAVGLVGGELLSRISQRSLPAPGLQPVRTLAIAFVLFGLAGVLHGSGFLAVFIAGIWIGELELPHRDEAEHVQGAAASLGEIVAFVVLGLTIRLPELAHLDVWLAGLVLAVLLSFLVRPLLVGACLVGSGLARNERAFVVLAGLKGAVPILLGTMLLDAPVADPERLYGLVVIVVVFSVLGPATAVPWLVRRLKLRFA